MSFIYGPPGSGISSSLILLLGDTGFATADTITLTGDANKPFFTGAGSTVTESINYVSLPTTTSSVGQITLSGSRFLHGYGTNNTFIGKNAGSFTLSSASLVGIGVNALQTVSAAASNTTIAIGTNALQAGTTAVGGSVAIGYNAFSQVTNNNNGSYVIGTNACSDAGTGVDNNVIIGTNAMTGSSKTTAQRNVIVGANAGTGITTGDYNLILGDSSGQGITTGTSNIRINCVNVGNTSNRLVIGDATGTGTRQLNEAFIHGIRGITTVNNNAIAVLIDSAGQLGTVSSSVRFKENIEDMGEISSSVLNLRPVTFDFIGKPFHKKQVGLIAEEVKPIIPDLVVHDKDGQIESVKYHEISIYLLNEIKKALKRVEYLESKLAL